MNRPTYETPQDLDTEQKIANWYGNATLTTGRKLGIRWLFTSTNTARIVDIHSASINRRWELASANGYHYSSRKWKQLQGMRGPKRNRPVTLVVGWSDPHYEPHWISTLEVKDQNYPEIDAGRTRRMRDSYDMEKMLVIPMTQFRTA